MEINDSFKNFGKIFVSSGVAVITVFTALGVSLLSVAQLRVLNCQRQQLIGTCQVKNINGPWQSENVTHRFSLQQLKGAELQEDISRSKRYRLAVVTEQGSIPLTDYYDAEIERKQEVVNNISNFITNPNQPFLNIQQDERWFFFLIGGSFIIISNIVGISFICIGINLSKQLKPKTKELLENYR